VSDKRLLRTAAPLLVIVIAATACTIEEGDFDASFDFDANVHRDSGDDTDDGGASDADDAGSASDAATSKPDASTGPNGGPDAAMEPSTLTPADVAKVIARGRCKALETCMGPQLLVDAYEGNDCTDFVTKQLADRHLHWLAESVEKGRVTFRPEALADCERDIAALSCDVANRPLPPSCERAVEGRAAVDGSCTIDQDCAGDAFCDKGMQETCPGQCAALQPSGLPCRSSSQCASGLVCDGGQCGTPLVEGDDCSERMNTASCPPGLVCQGRGSSLACRSVQTLYVGKLNEPCDALDKLCEYGLVCRSTSSTTSAGLCVPRVKTNEKCRAAEPNQCPADQYCKDADTNSTDRVPPGSDGICSARPQIGQPCPQTRCASGSRCLGEPPVCQALKQAGGQCSSSAECYGGLCEQDVCLVTTLHCP